VTTFGHAQKQELIDHLRRHPGSVVLVRTGRPLDDLVRSLPAEVELIDRERGMIVTTGRVVVWTPEEVAKRGTPGGP
jgi:hypothetical protein